MLLASLLPCLPSQARCTLAAPHKVLRQPQPRARKPAKPPVGLVDRLLQHRRPELAERGLDVPAPQPTRSRSTRQQGLLALPDAFLEAG
jgi:hypothetical protein